MESQEGRVYAIFTPISEVVAIVASTFINSTPFYIFTVDSILLRIELFRKDPSSAPGPAPKTSPAPAPDASKPTADASSPTPMMSPPAPPTSSPIGDQRMVQQLIQRIVRRVIYISKPIAYSRIFKTACPKSYSYSYNDPTSIATSTDYKATGYFDMPMFVQHTEAMMEEIDRMDEEIEMEDAEDWSVMDIDNSDKKNELTVVEYIDDIYAYDKKDEVHYKFELMEETLYLTMNLIDRFLPVQSVIRKKLQLVGITTLLLSCKYEEVSVPVVKDLILISDKAYARKEVLEMLELVSFFLIDLCLVEYEMLRFPPSMLAAAIVFTAQCTLGVSREWNATCEKHRSSSKNQIL
ncbi:Cyclin-B2-4 [Capsicum chinense]|nr:Cyclin-B2-4 [Capsicum chinense]